jgi:hypothetical protein
MVFRVELFSKDDKHFQLLYLMTDGREVSGGGCIHIEGGARGACGKLLSVEASSSHACF